MTYTWNEYGRPSIYTAMSVGAEVAAGEIDGWDSFHLLTNLSLEMFEKEFLPPSAFKSDLSWRRYFLRYWLHGCVGLFP